MGKKEKYPYMTKKNDPNQNLVNGGELSHRNERYYYAFNWWMSPYSIHVTNEVV